MTRCTRLFTFQTIRLILISRCNDTRLFILYSSSSSRTPSNIPTHVISTFFPSDISSSSCITEKFQTLDRQSTSPFFLCCYMLLDSPLLRVTHPTSAWPAFCFWRHRAKGNGRRCCLRLEKPCSRNKLDLPRSGRRFV